MKLPWESSASLYVSPLLAAILLGSGCVSWEVGDPDGDGLSVVDGDCDDLSPGVGPGMEEIWYDGIDQNCDGNDGDKDGDGFLSVVVGGTDCWDDPNTIPEGYAVVAEQGWEQPAAADVHPEATDLWYDGADADCGGEDDFDQDGDGHASSAHVNHDGEVGGDCIDGAEGDVENPAGIPAEEVNPDAEELFYDGTDGNCDDTEEWGDYDADQDGYPTGEYGLWDGVEEDCDDADPTAFPDPDEPEVWYNGVDENCDGNDGDQDGDGFVDLDYPFAWEAFPSHLGGGDCWDDPNEVKLGFDAINGMPQLPASEVYPGAPETSYDGIDADCASDSDFDDDGDGYDSSSHPNRAGVYGEDCADGDELINPGVNEDCATEGVDDDCDGDVNDESADSCTALFWDEDGDGYGTSLTACYCEPTLSYTTEESGDCDDSVDTTFPGAAEKESSSKCMADADGDGFGDTTAPSGGVAGNDCDDSVTTTHPGADEYCDGVDSDCDGTEDEDDALDASTWYADDDGDGYGDSGTTDIACYISKGWVADDSDCDDSLDNVYPGADEYCDGLDNDCDGTKDEDDSIDALTWYADKDGDGYGNSSVTDVACYISSGWVADDSDCDDSTATTYPGADEYCDGIDSDCDGTEDEDDALDAQTWYADGDGDTYGNASQSDIACYVSTGWVADATDCNDKVSDINPAALEECDGVDNNCDGVVDEATAVDVSTWYLDGDSDGYGLSTSPLDACDQPSGYVSDSTDCDDSEATTYPSADEYCDSVDNNCDGVVDEDSAVDASTWYNDPDGDGYGDATTSSDSCSQPSGYVSDATDCDHGDSSINPGATEYCDSVDNNCDGVVDEATAADVSTWYSDGDGDGYGDSGSPMDACDQPSGYVADSTDCDDSRSGDYPGATEYCDTFDNDCDGSVDESGAIGESTWYIDSDGDGYGVSSSTALACDEPSGYSSVDTDCNDSDSGAWPGATESCDGVDNDCDGDVDEGLIGQSSACSALDCMDIQTSDSTATSGLYWIDPTGSSAFQAYCDMSTQGGGWTLLISADGSSTYWGNNSSNWTADGSGTAQSTLSSHNDFHGQAFTDLETDEILLCYASESNCYNFNHSYGIPLKEFFTTGTSYTLYSSSSYGISNTGSSSSMSDYLSAIGTTAHGTNCQWLGINSPREVALGTISAIGLMGDWNGGCSGGGYSYHDDLAIGLGLQSCNDANSCSNGGSGHKAGQSRGWGGTDNSGVKGPWYVFGR